MNVALTIVTVICATIIVVAAMAGIVICNLYKNYTKSQKEKDKDVK